MIHTYVGTYYIVVIIYSYLFFFLFWNYQAMASPLVPDNRNPRFHTLSDTCFSDLLPPITSSSVITLSLGLCFTSAAWKPQLDIWNYSRLGEYRWRGKPNGKISKNVAHSNLISFCIGHWSSLHLDNCPLSSHFQYLISLFCWPTMKELESFSLGHSWSIEMVKMSLLLKANYRYIW